MGPGEGDRILGQRHQPHGDLDGIALQAMRQPVSVPALVELAEVRAYLLRKTEPRSDPLRDFAVAGEDRHADVHGVGEALLDGLRQFRRRRVREHAREGADESLEDLRMAAHVDQRQILAKRDLVAERRRQQMGVGIAPDVAEQGLMIDVAALFKVETGGVGQPHRQHARAQRKIPRLTGGEVGRIGQRHHEISAANRCCRHSGVVPAQIERGESISQLAIWWAGAMNRLFRRR